MKFSCLKLKNDNKNFKMFKIFGFDVFEVDSPENTDKKLKELIDNKYNTIIITSELSNFSRGYYKKI